MAQSVTKITKLEIEEWYRNNVTQAFVDILAEKQKELLTQSIELMFGLSEVKNTNAADVERMLNANARRDMIKIIYDAIKNKEVFA